MQWEQNVKLGDFRPDGDLLVHWFGKAELTRRGHRDRETRVECHFRIGYTADGNLSLVESIPQGKPETVELPIAPAMDKVVIPRGIRLRPFQPKDSSQDSKSSDKRIRNVKNR